MQNPIFSGIVDELPRSGKSFLVDPESVRLVSGTVGTSALDAKIRGHLADWKDLPQRGDRVLFTLRKNGGEFKILPASVSVETSPVPKAAPAKLEFGDCTGDETVEPLPKGSTVYQPLDTVLTLSWGDMFAPAIRALRTVLAFAFKARRVVRTP